MSLRHRSTASALPSPGAGGQTQQRRCHLVATAESAAGLQPKPRTPGPPRGTPARSRARAQCPGLPPLPPREERKNKYGGRGEYKKVYCKLLQ